METHDNKQGGIMKELTKVGTKGYPSMLVFAKVIRNIGYDHNTGDEMHI